MLHSQMAGQHPPSIGTDMEETVALLQSTLIHLVPLREISPEKVLETITRYEAIQRIPLSFPPELAGCCRSMALPSRRGRRQRLWRDRTY